MSKKFKRQCINCKEIKNKEELIRITKDYKTGEIKINNKGEYKGRSVYICKTPECIEKSIKRKKINIFLKTEITEIIKEELYTVLAK